MSRTWKDRPYKLAEREAIRHGYIILRRDWLHGGYRTIGNVDLYRRMSRRPVRAHSRWHDWRDYENDWHPEYGNGTRVRDALHVAADTYNSGSMDGDWDDPDVYQKRRTWKAYCYD